MYLTFFEYQEMGGEELEITAFKNLEFIAEGIVNKHTYNRLINETDIPEAVKHVVFQLINIEIEKEKSLNADYGTVSSQSNDGVSVSYSAMSPENVYQNLEVKKSDIVQCGLFGVKNSKGHSLLYRGMYSDE